jgi:hypothetical protein
VRRLTFRDAFASDPWARSVTPSPAESVVEQVEEPPAPIDAPLVEGSEFISKTVANVEPGFTHFLDGAQRSWRAMYHGLLPVTLSHTSAALLRRTDCRLEAPSEESYRGALEAFVPDVGTLSSEVGEILATVPIPVSEEDTGVSVALKTRKSVEERRKARELELVANFTDGRLLVDGGLGEALGCLSEGQDVFGLVKSHQRQYFKSSARQEVILNLKPGERTVAFLRAASPRQGRACYSFYLKMRDQRGEGPMFGLVRIEVPATDVHLAQLDAIAGWVLAERAPVSLPDPRFHVLVYPIHLVEEHLKARQPSEASIRALLGI